MFPVIVSKIPLFEQLNFSSVLWRCYFLLYSGIHEMEFVKLSGFGKIHQAAVENLCDKLHENSSRKSQFIGGLRTVIGSNEIVFLHQHDDMNQMLENQLARSHFCELLLKLWKKYLLFKNCNVLAFMWDHVSCAHLRQICTIWVSNLYQNNHFKSSTNTTAHTASIYWTE